jgi:OmpA-OmpF porin, OOP family
MTLLKMKYCFVIFLLLTELVTFSQNDTNSILLGDNINSIYNELHPLFSPDGKTLYFIRVGDPENTNVKKTPDCEDMWYSELQSDGSWSKAVHMAPPFNKSNYNAILSISPDGNTFLIKGAFKKGEFFDMGFSVTHKTDSGWSPFEMLDIKDFPSMSKGFYYGGCLSSDGKVLLMYFSETNNCKESNLYVSLLKKKSGMWTRPKKLRFPVNTKYDDFSPFLATDGKTMYFASNRPGGFGGNDIYFTRRLDNTWTNWSVPKNLGKSINTEKSESYYFLGAAPEYAYVITDKNVNKGTEIIKIKLSEEIKPVPVVLIAGKVLNSKTKEPLSAFIQYTSQGENTEAETVQSDPATGEYKIILPYGKNYSFSTSAIGFVSVSDNIDLSKKADYREIKQDLLLAPVEVDQTVGLDNIFFDKGKATLRPESYPEIDKMVEMMKNDQTIEIELSGYSDNVGSDDADIKLSTDRANAIRDYIIRNGISVDRITVKGYNKPKTVTTTIQ